MAQLRRDYDSCDLIGSSSAAVFKVAKLPAKPAAETHSNDGADPCKERVWAAKTYSNDGVDPCKVEYDLLRRLDHPSIPKAHQFYAGHRNSAFVMEFVRGSSLEALTRDPLVVLEPADVLHVAARVCAALAHAHALGVSHHDVACDNILYDRESGQVALLDWNYARDWSPATPDTACSSSVVDDYAKPLYRAPKGEEGRGDQQDVYALGVVVRRALAEVPAEVAAWLERLLAPPAQRATAAEALAALAQIRVSRTP